MMAAEEQLLIFEGACDIPCITIPMASCAFRDPNLAKEARGFARHSMSGIE
jgi:hypothetical protein